MGAPRVHGELLKLGMDVGQITVAKYMAKRRRPPSQGWRTFVHNHADAGCDSPSQCGMACPSADRCLRLGRASTLLDPRPRRRVWRCLDPAHPGQRHSRPTGLGALALAEWIRERLIGSIRRNVLITSSLASAIFATFSHRTKNTTTRLERTYRCRRTRRFGVMCAEQGVADLGRARPSICSSLSFRQGHPAFELFDNAWTPPGECQLCVRPGADSARYSCGEIRNSPMIWELAKKRGAG
jgi:hypothetical protein